MRKSDEKPGVGELAWEMRGYQRDILGGVLFEILGPVMLCASRRVVADLGALERRRVGILPVKVRDDCMKPWLKGRLKTAYLLTFGKQADSYIPALVSPRLL